MHGSPAWRQRGKLSGPLMVSRVDGAPREQLTERRSDRPRGAVMRPDAQGGHRLRGRQGQRERAPGGSALTPTAPGSCWLFRAHE